MKIMQHMAIALTTHSNPVSAILRYLLAACAVAAGWLFGHYLKMPPVFLPGIAIAAWYGGLGPGLFSAALSMAGMASYLGRTEITSLNNAPFFCVFSLTALSIAWIVGKQSETAEMLTLFRSLVDHANDAIEVVDPENGRFLDVNQQACITHGYTREEYLALRVQDMNPRVSDRPWAELIGELRKDGSRVVETQHRRKDGTFFPVEINVTYVRLKRDYMLAVVRDITERKKTEEQVEQAERNFRLAIDTIPTMTWSVLPDGKVDFVNERWMVYTGLTMQQELEKPSQALHPDDLSRVMERWRKSMAAGEVFQEEMRLRRADGEYRWCLVITSPLRDTQQRIVKWYGAATDITDRKIAEDELRKTQSDLARVMRVSIVGELTASIAHEVNQPLAAVVANANACLNWMAATPPNFEEARDALQRIIRQGNRASEVVSRIGALLRKENPARTQFHFSEILKEIVALTESEMRKRNVALQTQIASETPMLTADRVQLQQVLLNLVLNALDALDEITTRPRVMNINGSTNEPGELCVTVEDNGIGIEPAHMGRLFEAFYTTKPNGLGMGLSISRSIIEAHGGKLWAESIATQGSRFMFTLPVGDKDTKS
jgi:PAS domain S-box-containing protein